MNLYKWLAGSELILRCMMFAYCTFRVNMYVACVFARACASAHLLLTIARIINGKQNFIYYAESSRLTSSSVAWTAQWA